MNLQTFAQVLFTSVLLVLSAGSTAIGRDVGDASDDRQHSSDNLLAPHLLISRRATTRSELADTLPMGFFVSRRVTTAPSYDPAFRRPAPRDGAAELPVAARSLPAPREPKFRNALRPPARAMTKFPSLTREPSPSGGHPTKVMLPADK